MTQRAFMIISLAIALATAANATPAALAYVPGGSGYQPSAGRVEGPERSRSIFEMGPLYADASRAGGQGVFSRVKHYVRNPKTRVGHVVRMFTRRPTELTASEAAKLIKPGDHVFLPIGHQTAKSVVDALAARAQDPHGGLDPQNPVTLVGLSNVATRKIYDRGGLIVARSPFLDPGMRDAVDRGHGDFVPSHLSRVPRLIREGKLQVDTALLQVSPPDGFGYVTLGASTAVTPTAIDKAKTVIAEINPNVPRTNGAARVHVSELDYVVKSDAKQVAKSASQIGETEKAIARHIVGLIPKNPTLQFGIGGIPDAVAAELASSGRKDLRVHSEMISDGVMRLVKAGAVKGKVRYSFAMGSEEMLKWLDGNNKLRAYPTEYTNDVERIGRNNNMVSVNSALRVDLNGQINAQYVRDSWYSGVGGQVDFFRGAMRSKNGKAILAIASTAMVRGEDGQKRATSAIVPSLDDHDVVTTSMYDVQYVVTEHGVANLDGKSAVERARALIAVAAPQFRAELTTALEQKLAARKAGEESRYERFLNERAAQKKKDGEKKPAWATAAEATRTMVTRGRQMLRIGPSIQ